MPPDGLRRLPVGDPLRLAAALRARAAVRGAELSVGSILGDERTRIG
ncbi:MULTISPECIES: hypothetical protein [unclassified Streptomyces]|nr:hypothetical protein [Streptomyces sp. sk2.1]